MADLEDMKRRETNRKRHVCESQPLRHLFTVDLDEVEKRANSDK